MTKLFFKKRRDKYLSKIKIGVCHHQTWSIRSANGSPSNGNEWFFKLK